MNSGSNAFVAVFSAVTEDIWKQIKLTVNHDLFALTEVWQLSEPTILGSSNSQSLLHNNYTTLTGSATLVDIASFVTVNLSQLLSYKPLTYQKLPLRLYWVTVLLLVCLADAFVFFTFMLPSTRSSKPVSS